MGDAIQEAMKQVLALLANDFIGVEVLNPSLKRLRLQKLIRFLNGDNNSIRQVFQCCVSLKSRDHQRLDSSAFLSWLIIEAMSHKFPTEDLQATLGLAEIISLPDHKLMLEDNAQKLVLAIEAFLPNLLTAWREDWSEERLRNASADDDLSEVMSSYNRLKALYSAQAISVGFSRTLKKLLLEQENHYIFLCWIKKTSRDLSPDIELEFAWPTIKSAEEAVDVSKIPSFDAFFELLDSCALDWCTEEVSMKCEVANSFKLVKLYAFDSNPDQWTSKVVYFLEAFSHLQTKYDDAGHRILSFITGRCADGGDLSRFYLWLRFGGLHDICILSARLPSRPRPRQEVIKYRKELAAKLTVDLDSVRAIIGAFKRTFTDDDGQTIAQYEFPGLSLDMRYESLCKSINYATHLCLKLLEDPLNDNLLSAALSFQDARLPFRIDFESREPLTLETACYVDALAALGNIYLCIRRELARCGLSAVEDKDELEEDPDSGEACARACCTSGRTETPFVYLERAEELRSIVFQLAKVHRQDLSAVMTGSYRLKRCAATLSSILKVFNERGLPCRQIFERARAHFGACSDLKSFLTFLAAAVRVVGGQVSFDLRDEVAGMSGVVVSDVVIDAEAAYSGSPRSKRASGPYKECVSDDGKYSNVRVKDKAYLDILRDLREAQHEVLIRGEVTGDGQPVIRTETLKGIESLIYYNKLYYKNLDQWKLVMQCRCYKPDGPECSWKGVLIFSKADVLAHAQSVGKVFDWETAAPVDIIEWLVDTPIMMWLTTQDFNTIATPSDVAATVDKWFSLGGHCHSRDQARRADRNRAINDKTRMYGFGKLHLMQKELNRLLPEYSCRSDKATYEEMYRDLRGTKPHESSCSTDLRMNFTDTQFPWDQERFVSMATKHFAKPVNGKSTPRDSDRPAQQQHQCPYLDEQDIDNEDDVTSARSPIVMRRSRNGADFEFYTAKALMWHGQRAPALYIDGTHNIVKNKVVITICAQLPSRKIVPIAIAVTNVEYAEDFGYVLSMSSAACVTGMLVIMFGRRSRLSNPRLNSSTSSMV
jgi:hypothetical protein